MGKIASEGLKGRVFECSLADLQGEKDAERSYRKFKLLIEEIQGKNCLTSFHGMNLTTDKLRSMVKKWQTLIEGNVDVKTTDGYMLRLFCIGFTTKLDRSTKKTCYAQSAQVKNIRKKMVDIIQREVSSTDLKDVVAKLIPDSIASDIAKACQGIYPLHDVHIRKVKDAERSYRKFKLLIEEIQGKNCLTSFHGMNLTTDKLRSMVKKWQTLIEGNIDVKTSDVYMLRVFCIGFTLKQQDSKKKTCYAQSAQVKNISEENQFSQKRALVALIETYNG